MIGSVSNVNFFEDFKMRASFLFLTLSTLVLSLSSCARNSDDVWEDTKTAGRYMKRGVKSLYGDYEWDSRAINSREEFMPFEDYSSDMEYVPLEDMESNSQPAALAPQPAETPGDPGSSIPGIEAFRDPSLDPKLAPIFRTIHFDYNSQLITSNNDINTIKNVAYYMQQHPNTYVFVAGHCDERGPEAYNLALGSRRSNSVRNLLISEGVNPDNIFTISYGKEKPLFYEHNEEAWSQNRRAEFKVYQR